ncbi:MAG: type II toxin-antitoxin system VapC family toxin [Solirubrobacterales bacterium]
MTLADTSAWIELLRATGSRVNLLTREAIAEGAIATTEPVVMELLAGAGSRDQQVRIRRLLAGAKLFPIGGLELWENAAAIHRRCRLGGAKIRSQLDCLIAAVAMREDVPVLHADRDFDRIALIVPVRVAA